MAREDPASESRGMSTTMVAFLVLESDHIRVPQTIEVKIMREMQVLFHVLSLYFFFFFNE